jgi:hypothetical protein
VVFEPPSARSLCVPSVLVRKHYVNAAPPLTRSVTASPCRAQRRGGDKSRYADQSPSAVPMPVVRKPIGGAREDDAQTDEREAAGVDLGSRVSLIV